MLKPRRIKGKFLSSEMPELRSKTLVPLPMLFEALAVFLHEDLGESVTLKCDKIPEGAVYISTEQLAYALRIIVCSANPKDRLEITLDINDAEVYITIEGRFFFTSDDCERLKRAAGDAGFQIMMCDRNITLLSRREAFIPQKLYQGEFRDLLAILRRVFFD